MIKLDYEVIGEQVHLTTIHEYYDFYQFKYAVLVICDENESNENKDKAIKVIDTYLENMNKFFIGK